MLCYVSFCYVCMYNIYIYAHTKAYLHNNQQRSTKVLAQHCWGWLSSVPCSLQTSTVQHRQSMWEEFDLRFLSGENSTYSNPREDGNQNRKVNPTKIVVYRWLFHLGGTILLARLERPHCEITGMMEVRLGQLPNGCISGWWICRFSRS